jgi:formylglycine-generating enzyme required for sulfatase activity
MKQLTGGEFKALREAIQAAYRSRFELKRVVREELGVSLNQIAPESVSLTEAIAELIDWAEAKGQLEALLRGFLAEAENPTLRQLCDRLLQQASPAPIPTPIPVPIPVPIPSPAPTVVEISPESLPQDLECSAAITWGLAERGGRWTFRLKTGKQIEVTIPAGVRNGQRLRLAGQGENGGDLYLRLEVASPPKPEPQLMVAESQLQRFRAETVQVDQDGSIVKRHIIEPEYFTERVNGIGIEMVAIPGGRFWMGSPNGEADRLDMESPQHEVSVSDFFLGKFTVTQAQWRAVAQLPQINKSLNADPSNFKGDNRPVEQVSWDDAQEFCARLSQATGKAYRLPSEAQWEYACRAGTTTPFAFGATLNTDIANYRGDLAYGNGKKGVSREQTVDVGSFPPNAWGLYDMHGNVWEWCEDSWHNNYNGAPTDGTAWIDNSTESKLLRGGSWIHAPRNCRSAIRGGSSRDDRDRFIGFRVLCVSPRAL